MIESMVAVSIIAIGVIFIYLGFLQVRRISQRNFDTSLALTILNTQIDTDSQLSYAEMTPTAPVVSLISQLPNATIARTITEDTAASIKKIYYVLAWDGSSGSNQVKANYELVGTGLNND